MAVGFGLRQGEDGGGGNLVGLETDERAVDIEKQGVSYILHLGIMFCAAKVVSFLLKTSEETKNTKKLCTFAPNYAQ